MMMRFSNDREKKSKKRKASGKWHCKEAWGEIVWCRMGFLSVFRVFILFLAWGFEYERLWYCACACRCMWRCRSNFLCLFEGGGWVEYDWRPMAFSMWQGQYYNRFNVLFWHLIVYLLSWMLGFWQFHLFCGCAMMMGFWWLFSDFFFMKWRRWAIESGFKK